MNKKEDIINGLFSVMDRYEFSIITVTQIAQEAMVGRKTFYRHFKSKEDVLEEAIERLFVEYSSFQKNYYSAKFEVLIYSHFSFWNEHLYFLNLLYKNNLMLYLFKQYQKYVSLLNQDYLKSLKSETSASKYANAFTTGIFWSMLYTWIENGAKESPKEIATICLSLFRNRLLED
ncbi:AcrR family transcriptional regulator [Sporosarcina luteola]|nr:AcrR family transcriptional regulator [Sporosarcina luteola]